MTADAPAYRDPHPSLRERLYWLYQKHVRGEDIPPIAYVTLCCPQTGEVFATENTEPTARELWSSGARVSRYDCPLCGSQHRFLWGAPAPIRLPDQPREGVDHEVVEL